MLALLGSIKCCTAPFALGRKQALGFTRPGLSLSLSAQHHALSWRKGSSFQHKASSICPCETSYLCYFLLLQFANFIIVQWKENPPFHHPPCMQRSETKEKCNSFPSPILKCLLYVHASVIIRPFSGVYLDDLISRLLVVADVRFACLMYACIAEC